MENLNGYCDLNVKSQTKNLNETLEKLIILGYRIVALNHEYELTNENGNQKQKGKKKKVNGTKAGNQDIIPEPISLDSIQESIKNKLRIYLRITISFSDNVSTLIPKLNQSKNLKKYDILAVIPQTQNAFMYCSNNMDVDIISFDPIERPQYKITRKMYNLVVDRGICFELMYGPMIQDSTQRKNIIERGHIYFALGKLKNLILTSFADTPMLIRNPYDVINLSLLFGIKEEQGQNAILNQCKCLLSKSKLRKMEKSLIQVDLINQSKKRKLSNDDSS